MATYGLLPEGFKRKPLDVILSDMQAEQLAGISPVLDLQPPDPIAVATGIVAAALDEVWQILAALYGGMDPDIATGDQLEGLSLLTGTDREAATKTQVPGVVSNVNAGFSAAPGTMLASINGGDPSVLFTNKVTVANTGGSPANITANWEAVNTGPQQCLGGTLSVIASPLSGWNSINNPNDGIPGSDIESDPNLRLRREEELQSGGAATADAIRSAVFEASQAGKFSSQVKNCTVYFNDSDVVDANGIPPHSIEVVCYQPGNTGDDDQALADLIFAEKGAGIGTWGNTTETSTDDQGFSETIRFTRPEAVPIYIVLTILTDPTMFPGDGATQVKSALAGFGAISTVGSTIYWKHVEAEAFNVAGVLDVPVFNIGTAPSPVTATNITLTFRQIGDFETANITLTVTP
jgi:hypothetical protein